jgi:hypothetical protein
MPRKGIPRKTRKVARGSNRYLLQSYWSGAPLSLLERACLTSWVAFGSRVHLYTHDSIKGLTSQIPDRIRPYVTVLDADAIVDRSRKFNYKGVAPKSKRADAFTALPFSDLFRYEMLRKVGGVWMDMDIVLIRPMPNRVLAAPYFFVSERTMQAGAYKSKEPSKPTNACIGARDPDSPWARWITDAAAATEATSAWTYMKVFQESLTVLDLGHYVEPPEFIMPVNWWDLDGIFTPGGDCLKSKYGVPSTCPDTVFNNPKTVGVHLFRGLLRKRDMPYEDHTKIPATSFLGRLLNHVDSAAEKLRGTG